MDPFPPAEDGPRYEMAQVGRELSDLTPAERTSPPVFREEVLMLVWSGLGLLALIAFFVGALLF
jgi:hypothetical protein